jgi:hypothetical protein
MEKMEIYCPHCHCEPPADARWMCEPGCATVWNTFWTRGLCPGCGKQWEWTQCLACGRLSPHPAWYHFPGNENSDKDTERRRELEAIG